MDSLTATSPDAQVGDEVAAPTKKSKKLAKRKSKKSTESDGTDDSSSEHNAVLDIGLQLKAHERTLCCALAKIAGKMEAMESRSALSAHAGLIAYRLDIPPHMTAHRKGLCYSLLSRYLEPAVTDSIRNLALIKGRKVRHCDKMQDSGGNQ